MEDVNKRGRIFFLLYLNLSAIPKKFTRYILTLSLNWNKHAKKNTQIHFKSDVFAAIAVVDAEAPLVSQGITAHLQVAPAPKRVWGLGTPRFYFKQHPIGKV